MNIALVTHIVFLTFNKISEFLYVRPFSKQIFLYLRLFSSNFLYLKLSLRNMDIILFALGIVCIIIGLPFCFSCQVRMLWEEKTRKSSQKNQRFNQHVRRNRAIGVFLMILGIVLISVSIPEVNIVF